MGVTRVSGPAARAASETFCRGSARNPYLAVRRTIRYQEVGMLHASIEFFAYGQFDGGHEKLPRDGQIDKAAVSSGAKYHRPAPSGHRASTCNAACRDPAHFTGIPCCSVALTATAGQGDRGRTSRPRHLRGLQPRYHRLAPTQQPGQSLLTGRMAKSPLLPDTCPQGPPAWLLGLVNLPAPVVINLG